MVISLREKAVIQNWFKDKTDSVLFLAKIAHYVDDDSDIGTAYNIIWKSLVSTFDDRQLSRFEAVLLWSGINIDTLGSDTERCLDFLEARPDEDDGEI